MKPVSKVLAWGKKYDMAELYGDARLAGFEVAIVESGIRGVRMNLCATPDTCTGVQSEETEENPTRNL